LAVFECTSHPTLLVIGGGQFVDGRLEVSGDRADLVRKVAATGKFTIHELDEDQEGKSQEQESSKGDELFDPSEHNAESVIEYLATLDAEDPDVREAERHRIVEAEQSGKARKSILSALEDNSAQE